MCLRRRSVLLTMAVLTALVNLAACQRPCPFNTMCSCRMDVRPRYAPFVRNNGVVSIDEVVCFGVPLSKMPDLPRGPIAQVDIANSGLTAVESGPLAGTQVDSLRLMANKIKHIEDRAFSSMSRSLTSLDLAFNELDAVPLSAMKDLHNLQWLNLHGNEIHSIAGDWSHLQATLSSLLLGDNDITSLSHKTADYRDETNLHDFESLTTINLDGNKISRLDRHSLPRTIQTLRLAHNLLRHFPTDLIEHLHHLQWLFMRGNEIEHLPQHTFRRVLTIEKFDLGENGLKSIPKHLFNHSFHVRDLSLDFNKLETLHPETFAGLNVGRILLNYNQINSLHLKTFLGVENTLEYLDLESNKLFQIPNALHRLKALKYLYISSNMISEIKDDTFLSFCKNLRVLSLSGNLLTNIPKALSNCFKLSHLNLGYNQISEIREDDFSTWASNLDTLLLRSNKITSLDENVFNITMCLRELSLSFNPLNYMHPNVFQQLSNTLESLEMSFTLSQEKFPLDILQPLNKLLWLTLDNNNIDSFQLQILNSFPNLQYLNLESNKIKSLDKINSYIRSNLTHLRLSYNKLETIESKTFTSLEMLQSISLSGNELKVIKTNGFHNLSKLVKIIMSNNKIQQIQSGAFSNLPMLTKLDLHHNQLFTFSMNSLKNSTNFEYSLSLNLSSNNLIDVTPGEDIINIRKVDLKHNNLRSPPKKFLEKISHSIRNLHLDYNNIASLELEAFGQLINLEELTLRHNKIISMAKHSFLGMDSLQILDLSQNNIDKVHIGQFSYLQQLRILDLSFNSLTYLSKESLRNTKIERLDLSNNGFVVLPSIVLSDVGSTLRLLKLNKNNIEHIDSTIFPSTPFLLNLDLSCNKLNILPDNVFANLDNLQMLDLSCNPLRANFKELFHYVQSLKHLHLADIGLKSMPALPLPNLVYLNLSSNFITEVNRYSIKGLTKLRHLYLRNNNLSVIPTNIWGYLPTLKTLDIGKNPVKEITSKSFQGLERLQTLIMDSIPSLEHLESDTFAHMKHLTSLTTQTWQNIEKQLGSFLSNVSSLRKLSVEINESTLFNQLHGVLNSRIKQLEIWGKNLKMIHMSAFTGLENNAELLLRIRDTQIEELPVNMVANLYRVPHLILDLRGNMLTSLTPDVFYTNITNWENIGTKIMSGGLLLNNNPWICDCRLVWLGHWLRRWLRESLQIHTMDIASAELVQMQVREAKCKDPETGSITSLIDLYSEDMSCHASALSNSATKYKWNSILYRTVLIFTIFAFTYR